MKNIFSLLFLFLFIACTSDNEQDYFSQLDCDTDNVYYYASEDNRSIASIVSNKCLNCHGVAGNDAQDWPLDFFYLSQVYGSILLEIINGEAKGIDQMPKAGSPQLTDCEKSQIESWINKGYPEYE